MHAYPNTPIPISSGDQTTERIRYFKARLAAVTHEYGEAGIPIDSLRRKFAQVGRHRILAPQDQLHSFRGLQIAPANRCRD